MRSLNWLKFAVLISIALPVVTINASDKIDIGFIIGGNISFLSGTDSGFDDVTPLVSTCISPTISLLN